MSKDRCTESLQFALREETTSPGTYDIIVPTRDRYSKLLRLLSSIRLELSYHRPHIIVVDDGSTDATQDLAASSEQRLTVVHTRRHGPAHARNVGVCRSGAKYLVFLDDDCVIPEGYAVQLQRFLERDDWDLLGGGMTSWVDEGTRRGSFREIIRATAHVPAPLYDRTGRLRCLPSANLVVRRQSFDLLRGFDVRFDYPGGEDTNLTQRAIALGLRIRTTERLWVYHEDVDSIRLICRKFFRYGTGHSLNEFLFRAKDCSAADSSTWTGLLIHVPRIVHSSYRDARGDRTWRQRLIRMLSLIARRIAYDSGIVIGQRRVARSNPHW
jgi:glycosyltransferase involved in cell wall biosynthesis